MRKYLSFFKNSFHVGLQYRASTVSAVLTQLPWGIMQCVAYKVLLESNTYASPMELSEIVAFIWLKEAFFALFNTWASDNEIFSMITDGSISYEMCRPVSIYDMWYFRTAGERLSLAALRFFPILLFAVCIPEPYRLIPPHGIGAFFVFLLTMFLGLGVTVAFCMLVYISAFFTISPQGMRMIMMGAVDLLSGTTIPLPMLPQPIRGIFELLPFGSMQNVPFQVYSGSLAGTKLLFAICLQIFWFAFLVAVGKLLCDRAQKRVVVQGG